MKKRQLAILGSTGSIGTQALEVVSEHSDLFEVYALTANNQVDLLINQARKYMPEVVVIANERKYPELKEALEDLPIKVWAGADAIAQMVQFEDGAVIAQLGIPDMKLPIAYAFSFPTRMRSMAPRLDFNQYSTLTFEEPDMERFRNLAFAFEAARQGGNMPCILNAANEVVVAAFLQDRIGFLQMSDVIERTMRKASFIVNPSYEDYVATDTEARRLAAELF